MPPSKRTRNRRRALQISASGSMWRWRSVCRSSPVIAPIFSDGCAASSAIARISALSATEGRAELDALAGALLDLEKKIPGEIGWVLRVDGHTDMRPINNPQFKSNWELSAARAISVVQYLMAKGVSPQHLVAAGFGEFQPIEPDKTEEAYARNRRIELKLTER